MAVVAQVVEDLPDVRRVELLTIPSANGDETGRRLAGTDDGLVRRQPVLADPGTETAFVRVRDLDPQPPVQRAPGDLGASQAGNAPPCTSINGATARSILPTIARCTITGRCLLPSAPTYSRPNRSG